MGPESWSSEGSGLVSGRCCRLTPRLVVVRAASRGTEEMQGLIARTLQRVSEKDDEAGLSDELE